MIQKAFLYTTFGNTFLKSLVSKMLHFKVSFILYSLKEGTLYFPVSNTNSVIDGFIPRLFSLDHYYIIIVERCIIVEGYGDRLLRQLL